MKNLIIVGAGGLASDLYGYLKNYHLNNVNIKGVLTDDINDYNNMKIDEKYLGKIKEYLIKEEDEFIVAIGENPGRKKIIDILTSRNVKFFTFIHQTSIIHYSAIIEEGSIIGPFCTIGSNAKVGKHALLNKYCNIGHGSIIDKGMIMYPYSMIGGNSKIGNNFVLSTRSTVWPGLVVGNNCTVSANVFLKKNSADNILYFNKETSLKELKL